MRPDRKARRVRIPAVFERGATPRAGMQRRPNAAALSPRAAELHAPHGTGFPAWPRWLGVGSVGTSCWVVFLEGLDGHDPLFLQVKQARPSVLGAVYGAGCCTLSRRAGRSSARGQHPWPEKVIRHFSVQMRSDSGSLDDAIETSLEQIGVRVLWVNGFAELPGRLAALHTSTGVDWRARIAARGGSPAAFGCRCIPAGYVAPSSHIAHILGRRALPAGRLGTLGATPDFRQGLLGTALVADGRKGGRSHKTGRPWSALRRPCRQPSLRCVASSHDDAEHAAGQHDLPPVVRAVGLWHRGDEEREERADREPEEDPFESDCTLFANPPMSTPATNPLRSSR